MQKKFIATGFLPASFSLKKSRIRTTPNPLNKTGFNYKLIINEKVTRFAFFAFVSQTPELPGAAIVLGVSKNNESRVVSLITSETNLCVAFKDTHNVLYKRAVELLGQQGIACLKIQLALAS